MICPFVLVFYIDPFLFSSFAHSLILKRKAAWFPSVPHSKSCSRKWINSDNCDHFIERRLAENADNLRGRALDMMMAGRLETGIEDELKKEIEVPEFMEKPPERWTEDEHKLAKEYEQKKIEVSNLTATRSFLV